ncbi:Obscurin-like protein [Thalictrum thalictroides]|uniref:Obscurin-like protein n=1 Tax=Thalictrum thalictroides TaxID=46969 RepID=A0A7J6W739_THATH|nr:Obscurin-like protein [Thalictrum thalictroides]
MKTQTFFLEEWLRSNSGTNNITTKPSPSSSARAIIQAWAELRDSLQNQSFQSHHLQSLQTLLNSQTSLHVADPQAKLLLSILSSPNFTTPTQSHHLFLKLLYIWLKKSSKPFVSLVESAVSVVSSLLSIQFDAENGHLVVSHGVLLLGAISSIPNLSESSKRVCLELLCRLMEGQKQLIRASEELVPEVLAGIGYALSSSGVVYFHRILSSLFEIWSKESGLCGRLAHGLMILHLFEWVFSGFVGSRSVEKIECVCQEILGIYRLNNVPFAVVMAAAGALRALNKMGFNSSRVGINAQLKSSLEECIESVARDFISTTRNFGDISENREDRVVLQCISMGATRSGLASYRGPLLLCLACALLVEVFPLRSFYRRIAEYPHGNFASLGIDEVKEHTDSILFKEAGAITRMLCNQYISADGENKMVVENLIWGYCQDLYSGHQQVAMVLQGGRKVLLDELEKIAEACFLMIVIFASVVTKHRLNSEISSENKLEISVKILISFSCIEYFRRVRLPEYTDTIRGVVVSVQENESSCIAFIKSLPLYSDLTKNPELLSYGKAEYIWSKNDVQTARVLFYLRVIPTCIERIPSPIYSELVAPTMFLYVGHPNGKVARASHSVFMAFVASGKDPSTDDRVLLKEQLVFYYMQRSLEGYPGTTPFEGMASGVVSLVRHLPAGSPAIYYGISSLVEHTSSLCSKAAVRDADMWKSWQGDSEPCKKLVELLLRLLSLVDIQVLPHLMKLLAQFIVHLPKDGQNMVLGEIHSLVAESDDVTRKPALVSWLQSLSFLCSKTPNSNLAKVGKKNGDDASAESTSNLTLNNINARL